MAVVKMLRVPLARFKRPATPALLSGKTAGLCRDFQKALLDCPQYFLREVRLPDHPALWVDWVALCKTSGLAVLRSGRATPEAVCLLLTGLESEEDMEVIRRHTPMFTRFWPDVETGDRPLGVCGFYSPSMMASSAVRTVFVTLANALFSSLGVGEP